MWELLIEVEKLMKNYPKGFQEMGDKENMLLVVRLIDVRTHRNWFIVDYDPKLKVAYCLVVKDIWYTVWELVSIEKLEDLKLFTVYPQVIIDDLFNPIKFKDLIL